MSVSGAWRTYAAPLRLASIDVTVTVPSSAMAVDARLVAVLEKCFGARSLNVPVHIRVEGT